MSEANEIIKSLDNIHCKISDTQIRTLVTNALTDFVFKGGDSDYRGFHFDGKNANGTEFSIEQMNGCLDLTPEGYCVDLWVRGPIKEEVENTFNTLLQVLNN